MAAQREAHTWKSRAERESFQLKLKDEVVGQLREQQRKSEDRFKQEVDKQRHSFSEKVLFASSESRQGPIAQLGYTSRESNFGGSEFQTNKVVIEAERQPQKVFRTALMQLNTAILEL